MPYSYQTFNGGAAGLSLAVSVPFLLRSHVDLYLNYDLATKTYETLLVSGTNYNWVNDNQISMITSTSGKTITLKRSTPAASLLVGWADGSNVDMDDLTTADRQNLYAVQEQSDFTDIAGANAAAALSAVNAALPYAVVTNVAAIPAAPANDTRIEIADSTGIQSFSPLTGRPAGFSGASNIVVRLKYSSAGSTWQWVDYRPTDPDARYGSIASVTAAQSTANSATTAAAAAQSTANSASAAASNAQSAANSAGSTATTALTAANNAGAAATAAQSTANTANATANGRQQMLLDTAKASTSGNAIDFTGIPSWAKKITVMFQSVSTNGASPIQIQLGAGSIDATNASYKGGAQHIAVTATSGAGNDAGFRIDNYLSGANTRHGAVVFTNIFGNVWVMLGSVSLSDTTVTSIASGSKALSGTLDRLRITTVAGNQAFDDGTINVLYEGYA